MVFIAHADCGRGRGGRLVLSIMAMLLTTHEVMQSMWYAYGIAVNLPVNLPKHMASIKSLYTGSVLKCRVW